MDNLNAAKSWFERADDDLKAAEFLADKMHPVSVEIVCYHCEQAAEKYMKGFLVLNDVVPQKTHDLLDLGATCSEFSKSFEDIVDALAVLTEYAVHIRYPSQIEISYEDMKRAIANARSVEALTLSLKESMENLNE